jgi:hypothetical protein
LAFISRNPARISSRCNHNHQPVQCSSTCSVLHSSAKESSPSEMPLIAAHYISQLPQQHCNGHSSQVHLTQHSSAVSCTCNLAPPWPLLLLL